MSGGPRGRGRWGWSGEAASFVSDASLIAGDPSTQREFVSAPSSVSACKSRSLRLCTRHRHLAGPCGRYAFADSQAHVQTLPNIDEQTSGRAHGVALSSTALTNQRKDDAMTNGTVKFYNEQKGFGF